MTGKRDVFAPIKHEARIGGLVDASAIATSVMKASSGEQAQAAEEILKRILERIRELEPLVLTGWAGDQP